MWSWSSSEVSLSSDQYLLSGMPAIFRGDLVEAEVDKVATQYREATKFLALVRAFLGEGEGAAIELNEVPSFFDIDSAAGDQLTIIGKWLGFPRCHCVCDAPAVFGFDCGSPGPFTIAGFCAPGSTWVDCPPLGNSTLCIDDDEAYRGMLKARRYQMMGLYDVASLQAAIRHVWGDTAQVADTSVGSVILAPGRALTADETAQLPVAFRVFPIAPGIRAMVHLGFGPIFGFGTGWGGFCENAEFLCPTDPHTYTCA
ncbi:hypothetical protein ASE63_22485 [Bosea sp. Root381]|uniref:DUF2612 domain-containing protein n=1 Tax=Bosea sp. Root381 TaxID=1736524 RepID=UPI0006FE212D|nr:DUF2612 domain-containing protein [Bosea sp. Root381]KRE07470.1 hypothetical protein ASE63_22485 [Bosea sp. Root381]